MTPQELRTSIYQLAFRGKLVAQFPDEGTADELYSIISTKYLSKKITAPRVENEDELPFEIPDTWKWVHLNHIATSNLGKTLDKVKNTGKLCPYLCSINVYWDGISLEKVKEARFEETEREKYLLQKGDLLVCEGGDVGRSAIWENDQVMYYQNALHRIRFFADIEPYFYKYLLECYKGMGIIDRYSKGVTIKHLVQNALYAMWIPLPPVAEQKRIVAKIEEILPLIDRYEAAWNKLEAFNKRFPGDMQKSILQLAIQGKLVEQRPKEGTGEELFQQIQAEKQALIKAGKIKKGKLLPAISDEEIPFDIPENWTWVRLSEICDVSDGTHQTPKYVEKGMPFISAQNIKPYRFMPSIHRDVSREDYEMYNKNVAPEKGDILMTRVGAGIGEAAIIDVDMEFSIYVSLTLIKCFLRDYDMRYLLYVLNSPHGRKLAEKKTLGKGASQGNLNLILL